MNRSAGRAGLSIPTLRGLAVFMGTMTIAWTLNGNPAAPAGVTVIGVALGALLVVAAIAVRPRPMPGPDEQQARAGRGIDAEAPDVAGARDRRGGRLMGLAMGTEVVAGLVAVVVLVRTGLGDFIAPVIALVVAVHFLIFLIGQRFWLHLAAGLFGSAGAGLAITLMGTGVIGAEAGRAMSGLSLAACTSAYGLAFIMALRRAPRTVGSIPAASAEPV